jgi:hypothetical protein
MVKPGDMIRLVEEPWSIYAGECVFVLKVDENEQGFDFVIPERRGHAPMKFAAQNLGNFKLDRLGVKM